MKRTLTLIIGIMIGASMAHGGDVKIKAALSTSTINTESPKIVATFKTNGAKKGDKVRAVWIADDVGTAAPANTKLDEATVTLEGDTVDGNFSCSKPNKGWPAGKYHVDIYVNDEVAATVKFHVEALEKAEKRDLAEKEAKEHAHKETTESADDEDDVNDDTHDAASDDDDAQYSFKVHNKNVQKITKLLASEDGKKFSNFDIGEGIDVGETVQLNWDQWTNKSGCKWWLKAVYADKSVGEAVKFDFCQPDLEIDF